MAFLTYDKLREIAVSDSARFAQKSIDLSEVKSTVFLSHSHKDTEIVSAVEAFLNDLNLLAYIDWKDATMPETTSPDTARALRILIEKSSKFLLLATENSLKSAWVPWELGVADGVKGLSNVAVLPVSKNDRTFPNNEYMAMYPRVDQARGGEWYVYPAGQDSNGVHFAAWLIL